VVAIALLMHLEDSELMLLSAQIAGLLEEKGLFICSFSSQEREEGEEHLFVQRSPSEMVGFFTDQGFQLRCHQETSDGLGRRMCWHTMVFSREPL
jgi:hypothetical protein